jgi:hypothetical protein
MFRAAVDDTKGYQGESLTRAALGNAHDAATKSILEQALSKNDEIVKWRVDGFVSISSRAAEGQNVRDQALDSLTRGMNAFENERFVESMKSIRDSRNSTTAASGFPALR